jgi:hypothetical protein
VAPSTVPFEEYHASTITQSATELIYINSYKSTLTVTPTAKLAQKGAISAAVQSSPLGSIVALLLMPQLEPENNATIDHLPWGGELVGRFSPRQDQCSNQDVLNKDHKEDHYDKNSVSSYN